MYGKILRPLYILIFEYILKWKIIGKKPDSRKFVIIVAPHTSNWDFMIGLWVRSRLRMNCWFIGKKELFIWPLGYLFRSLGGYPIDRSKTHNMVDQIANIFKARGEFNLTISPEGTRSYNPEWKTGFYHIAVKAEVPILMVGFDYEKRRVMIADPFYPSGDIDRDMPVIKSFFRQFRGKYPDQGVL